MGERLFEDEDLTGATFRRVDLTGAVFRDINLSRADFRGAWMHGVTIDGEVAGMTINGVEVAPLVQAELERRHPELALMRPADIATAREGFAVLEGLWAGTTDRARRLPEAALRERVDDEWSFTETLRHLVFATDSWIRRCVLEEPDPFWPAGMPHSEADDDELGESGCDRAADPSLTEVLSVRADRQRQVRELLAGLDDAGFAAQCRPHPRTGPPPAPEKFTVRQCVGVVLNEEWWHHRFATRDLAVLEAGA